MVGSLEVFQATAPLVNAPPFIAFQCRERAHVTKPYLVCRDPADCGSLAPHPEALLEFLLTPGFIVSWPNMCLGPTCGRWTLIKNFEGKLRHLARPDLPGLFCSRSHEFCWMDEKCAPMVSGNFCQQSMYFSFQVGQGNDFVPTYLSRTPMAWQNVCFSLKGPGCLFCFFSTLVQILHFFVFSACIRGTTVVQACMAATTSALCQKGRGPVVWGPDVGDAAPMDPQVFCFRY